MAAVTTTRKARVIWAEINRPEAANAVNYDVMEQLEKILDEIERNNEITAFILSGKGDGFFASGGDIKGFSHLKTAKEGREMAVRMSNILSRIENGDFWSVACINGDAYGGGCEMMLAFDFIISRKTAKFCFTQSNFKLPPGWGGLTRLVERVGRSRTLEWLGRAAIVPAEAAFSAGLINRLAVTTDLRNNTWKLAEEFSIMDRRLISALKMGIRMTLENGRRSSFENELDQFGHFWGHDDHHKMVSEFLNRKGG